LRFTGSIAPSGARGKTSRLSGRCPKSHRTEQEEVVQPFEGKYLNRDLPAFARTLPTCEALAEHFFRRIAPRLPGGATLERVRVSEDPTLYADCTGLA
jgi:hypothetical protein